MMNKKDIRKILVIRNDHIGDMILSTIVFRELKKNYPQAEITAIVSPSNRAIIEKNRYVKRIITLNFAPRKLKEFYNYFKVSNLLRKENYDVGIDLRGSYFNALLMFTAKVKYKIGFYEHESAKKYLDYFYKRDKNRHETSSMLDLINKALGLKCKNIWPEVQTDNKDKNNVMRFINLNKLKGYFCLVPEASYIEKQWPLKNMNELIKIIKRKYPSDKILLIARGEELVNKLVQNNRFCIPVINKNLRELHLLFKKSKAVVAPDGASLQLAWTSGANVVALLMKGLPIDHVKPLNKNSVVLVDKMSKIKPLQVYQEIKKLLRK